MGVNSIVVITDISYVYPVFGNGSAVLHPNIELTPNGGAIQRRIL